MVGLDEETVVPTEKSVLEDLGSSAALSSARMFGRPLRWLCVATVGCSPSSFSPTLQGS